MKEAICSEQTVLDHQQAHCWPQVFVLFCFVLFCLFFRGRDGFFFNIFKTRKNKYNTEQYTKCTTELCMSSSKFPRLSISLFCLCGPLTSQLGEESWSKSSSVEKHPPQSLFPYVALRSEAGDGPDADLYSLVKLLPPHVPYTLVGDHLGLGL